MTRLAASIALLVALHSCAPREEVVRVISEKPGYVVKETRITGRPILAERDSDPGIRIKGPGHSRNEPLMSIKTTVTNEVLKQKLDPRKSYDFQLYTTDQSNAGLPDGRTSSNATLVGIKERGTLVVDASICQIHHCPMQFVEETQVMWNPSKEEKRRWDVYPNHGLGLVSCSFGSLYSWKWRCPKCAKMLESFRLRCEG